MEAFNKNKFEEKVSKTLSNLNLSNIEVGGVPLAVGDKLVINVQQDLAPANFNGNEWLPIKTIDGGTISAKALTRARNGLRLTKTTFTERLVEALMMCDEQGFLRLGVTSIRTKQFPEGVATYYTFNCQQAVDSIFLCKCT